MPTFNYQKALAAGYSPEQIDEFVKKNKLTVKNQQQAPASQPQQMPEVPTAMPQPQPSFNEKIGQGLMGIGKTIAAPFVRTGKNIAGALTQAPLSLRAADLANVVNDETKSDEEKDKALKELRRVNQLSKLLKPFASDTADVGQQARDSLNVASYAVPFGKGANVVTKALLPGATVGAMQEASKEGATASSIVGGGVTGAAAGGLTYGATKLPGLLKSFGKGTQRAGDALTQSQMNLPRSIAKDVNLPETMSTLNRYGFSKLDKIAGQSDDVIKVLEKPIQKAVSKAKPVKLDGFTEVVKDIVGDPSLPVGRDEKILTFVDKLVQKITKGGSGSQIKFEADPNSTLEIIRTLQKKAADVAKGKLPAAITDEERALKQAYRLIADELQERLFVSSGADNMVAGEIPDLIAALSKFSPELAKDAAKAKTIGELRSLMAPFVRGKIAAETTEFGRNLATETMGGSVRGVGKFIQNPLNIAAIPLGSDVVNAGVGNVLGKTGRVLQSSPQLPQQVSNAAANIGSRLPQITEPLNPNNQGNGEAQNNEANPSQEQESSNVQSDLNHMKKSVQPLTRDVKGQTGYSYNELTRAYAKAQMNGDTKLAARIKPLIEIEKEALPADEKKSSTASERLNSKRATIGLRALKDAEKLLKEDPNLLAKGLLPGKLLSRKYENAAVRAAEQILRMQTGAVVSKDEAKRYAQDFMPWFGDDPETIQYKLEQMRLDYEQFLQ